MSAKNKYQKQLPKSVRMRTPRLKRRTLPPGLQEQPWLARDTDARRTSKNNRFDGRIVAPEQIRPAELLIETWFVATLNDGWSINPADPRNTQGA
jgi:hypothetical protein